MNARIFVVLNLRLGFLGWKGGGEKPGLGERANSEFWGRDGLITWEIASTSEAQCLPLSSPRPLPASPSPRGFVSDVTSPHAKELVQSGFLIPRFPPAAADLLPADAEIISMTDVCVGLALPAAKSMNARSCAGLSEATKNSPLDFCMSHAAYILTIQPSSEHVHMDASVGEKMSSSDVRTRRVLPAET